MRTYEREAQSIDQYAVEVAGRGTGTFHSKETRDAVAKLLRQQGHTVTKSSIRGQNLHPEYVTDYVGTVESGFGNTQYQTYWSVLYIINIAFKSTSW